MNQINLQTIKNIFVEYGITNNPDAYNPHDPQQMHQLRTTVKKDAERFLKSIFGDGYHISNNCDVTMLTEYFFESMMRKGIRNVAKRGWR